MASRTKIDDPDLLELLDGIHRGVVGLPNFQRDFDWSDGAVRSLLATVLNGWPLGSILLIEGGAAASKFYQPRPFEFAPSLRESHLEEIVLDGQQRLTALYTALYGHPTLVHALDVSDSVNWADIDAVEEAISTHRRKVWEKKYPSVREQWAARLVPATALRTASDFFAWRDAAVSDDDERIYLTEVYQNHLSGLHRYRVPALRIDTAVPPPAVARIFERVNRTGIRLGTFDLMVAKTFSPAFNLREEWEAVKSSHSQVYEFFKGDGTVPLQVISLRNREDVRGAAVLELTPAAVHDGWGGAVESLGSAIEVFREYFGVFDPDWLPYQSTLIVLAALIADEFPVEDRIQSLKDWYWKACFSGRYASGSNTTAVSDYKTLTRGEIPSSAGFTVDQSSLMESTKQSSGALHRAWVSLLAHRASDCIEGNREFRISIETVIPRGLVFNGIPAHLLSLGFSPTLQVADDDGTLFERPDLVDPALRGERISHEGELGEFLIERAQYLISALRREMDIPVSLGVDESLAVTSD
ncbi:GmrSD restriction endonuclease domain-containing protein [Micrococcus luteus]|uniref:GmrSD restriction endonuclease domain-containing protein n=1 Tax=Micrococcus luteus TaxID=1270 RepID=UPI00365F5069